MKGTLKAKRPIEGFKYSNGTKEARKFDIAFETDSGLEMGALVLWEGQEEPELNSEIELEKEDKGQFGIQFTFPRSHDQTGKKGGFGAKADPAKTASIERQSAIKSAVDFYKERGQANISDVLQAAEKFAAFIAGEKDEKPNNLIEDKPLPQDDPPAWAVK
jgi:hypothetical protein